MDDASSFVELVKVKKLADYVYQNDNMVLSGGRDCYQGLQIFQVDAEKSYHQSAAGILDKLYAEMVQVKQHTEVTPSLTTISDTNNQPAKEDPKLNKSGDLSANGPSTDYFVAEVIHPFDAQAEGELTLSVGDFVVVRQVAPHGWSEGECNGNAGWFPSTYVQRRDKAPASKVINTRILT